MKNAEMTVWDKSLTFFTLHSSFFTSFRKVLVSESALPAGYLPEEHAPDPMFSHGDPTPPGKVGIWLFLASEIMFFVAILGSYIILRGGSHDLFADHALALSKPAAATNTVVLIFSSLTMALSVDAAQKKQAKR